MASLSDGLDALLALPRRRQREALEAWLTELPEPQHREAWNTAFGPGSLFEAWTSTSIVKGLYAANAREVRTALDGRTDWRIVEVGGGDGSLWARALQPADAGDLVVIDPMEEVHEAVPARLPFSIRYRGVHQPVEEVELPEADLVVCSLTLHHVAGADVEERAKHGMSGPGKLEVLRAFADALRPRDGLLLLNEADIHCDLELASGDELLADRLLDSYVRRCARGVIADAELAEDPDRRLRLEAIVRHWMLEQVRMADVPVADRDVYELDVPRWLALLERAGFEVLRRGFTDEQGLFHQYVARVREAS